ncbi:MAG: hypothetical protein EHM58_07690, partial [Ignavibacteriae bacterium]
MPLKKIYLNEKAIGFVTEQLTKRVSLDFDIFSEFLTKSKLEIWGYFTRDLSEEDLTEFQYGGKFDGGTEDEVINLLENYLEKDSQNRWMLIDVDGRTTYPVELKEVKGITKVFYYKDIVFHILFKHLEMFECIQLTFKFTGSYPFIGF